MTPFMWTGSDRCKSGGRKMSWTLSHKKTKEKGTPRNFLWVEVLVLRISVRCLTPETCLKKNSFRTVSTMVESPETREVVFIFLGGVLFMFRLGGCKRQSVCCCQGLDSELVKDVKTRNWRRALPHSQPEHAQALVEAIGLVCPASQDLEDTGEPFATFTQRSRLGNQHVKTGGIYQHLSHLAIWSW